MVQTCIPLSLEESRIDWHMEDSSARSGSMGTISKKTGYVWKTRNLIHEKKQDQIQND